MFSDRERKRERESLFFRVLVRQTWSNRAAAYPPPICFEVSSRLPQLSGELA